MINPENPIVKLCVAGMQAEAAGDFDGARRQFTEAWEQASDDFERCIAAHYVARHQPTAKERLRWNQQAYYFAEAVGDERVRDFFPSLFLNLGQSYEEVGQADEARRYYELAADGAAHLPEDRYGKVVRRGATAGQERMSINED